MSLHVEAVLGLQDAASTWTWRRIALPAALALVILGVLYVSLWRGEDHTAVRWISEEVTRGELLVMVTATGTVEPTNEVDISSELSGTVRAVLVDFNDQVEAGQVLAELDTDKLEAQAAVCSATLASRQARVLEARATLTETQQLLTRAQRLVESGARSAQDLDTALAAHQRALAAESSAEAELLVARADLRLKQTDLSKARITSPIRGVVLLRNVDPGQTVAASLQAPILFTLAEDLSHMELQVDVDEADVGVTKVGQEAIFTVDAYPGRSFPARLRQLRLAPQSGEGVVTYKAILSLDNSERLLLPGMTATAEITVHGLQDALLVPNAALRFEPPPNADADQSGLLDSILPGRRFRRLFGHKDRSEKQQVWVLRDGAPAAVQVEVGPTDGDHTAIRAGDLQPGQAVLVDVE